MVEASSKKSVWAYICSAAAILLSLFHIYTSAYGILPGLLQPVVHFAFVLIITYTAFERGRTRHNILMALCLIVSCITMGYIIWNHEEVLNRMPYIDPVTTAQLVLGILFTILVLEQSWRLLGPSLSIMSVVCIAYAFVGPWMPGFLYHKGFTVAEQVEQYYLTFNGIFGSALIISATVVFIFILFGSFLEKSGAGEHFMEIVKSLAGHRRGGPAIMAVFASALMGMISGSAVANVMTVGTFTIPLMKRVGYDKDFAAAVEASASTGGQIMPPVMGAAAFIMAEYLGISYGSIAIAAAIPASLYFLGVAFQVYLEARKLNLPKLPKSELRPFWSTLKEGWHILLALCSIVYFLMQGYTAMKAGLYGIITVLIVVAIRDRKRLTLKNMLGALEGAGKATIAVSGACACAGIIIGVFRLTGIGLTASSLVMSLAQGHLFLALVLTAITAIILGTGLPTTASYIILAAIAAPALVKMGLPALPAHLFVFYFSCIAVITPPVALAAYAAAPIAGGDPDRIGWIGCRLGIAAYIAPFMFVYNPALLLQGTFFNILTGCCTAVIGVFALAASIEGWALKTLTILERLLYFGAASLLILPGAVTDVAGIVLMAALLFFGHRASAGPKMSAA